MPKKRGLGSPKVSPEQKTAIGKKGNAKLRELGKIHKFASGAESRRAQHRMVHPEEKILEQLRNPYISGSIDEWED